jgi:hypothetical protein
VHNLSIVDELVTTILINKEKLIVWKTGEFDTSMLSNRYYYFELKEDKIEIQNIEEINDTCYDVNTMSDDEIEYYHNTTASKINDLIKAVKQLDEKIK